MSAKRVEDSSDAIRATVALRRDLDALAAILATQGLTPSLGTAVKISPEVISKILAADKLDRTEFAKNALQGAGQESEALIQDWAESYLANKYAHELMSISRSLARLMSLLTKETT